VKRTATILSLSLLLTTAAALLAGCGDHDHYRYHGYYITVINDTPWTVFVEPFGIHIHPGDAADIEIGYDAVYVVVVRDFDGLVLTEGTMTWGDVLVVD